MERLDPPVVVAQAVASVIGASSIEKAAVAKNDIRSEGEAPATTWRYVALTAGGLVVAEVTNDVADWEMGSQDTDPEPSIDARLVPIREITFCRVDRVARFSTGPEEWSVSWSIGLRGEKPVQLPVGTVERARTRPLISATRSQPG
ncbi:hypothetical protein [Kribbella sp. VKM Ac-2566]|uniref:hypothetical protein n=1 Tax=Kribbella sp. VKM Ac-2566 TaxID=2512218 RepID=UPI00106305C2|nr:hypothetical protein [Kribbella sp. VKM Ac-2566]